MSVLSSRRHQWTQTVTRSGGVGAAVDGGEVGGGEERNDCSGIQAVLPEHLCRMSHQGSAEGFTCFVSLNLSVTL